MTPPPPWTERRVGPGLVLEVEAVDARVRVDAETAAAAILLKLPPDGIPEPPDSSDREGPRLRSRGGRTMPHEMAIGFVGVVCMVLFFTCLGDWILSVGGRHAGGLLILGSFFAFCAPPGFWLFWVARRRGAAEALRNADARDTFTVTVDAQGLTVVGTKREPVSLRLSTLADVQGDSRVVVRCNDGKAVVLPFVLPSREDHRVMAERLNEAIGAARASASEYRGVLAAETLADDGAAVWERARTER